MKIEPHNRTRMARFFFSNTTIRSFCVSFQGDGNKKERVEEERKQMRNGSSSTVDISYSKEWRKHSLGFRAV